MSRRVLPILLMVMLHLEPSAAALGQEADPDRERDDQIGLADLAGYRTALSGKPTADDARPADPPARVGFRDLWERPATYKGRRVTVDGRVERSFRQGAVGSFPPLVEAWLFSPAGDPLCVVYPQPGPAPGEAPAGGSAPVAIADPPQTARDATPIPQPGRAVRFTGTFLKMIRYAAGDGQRLAPLIVGDRPPSPQPAETGGRSTQKSNPSAIGEILRAIGGGGGGADDHDASDRRARSPSSWSTGLTLAALAAGLLALQYLRRTLLRSRPTMRRRPRDQTEPDLPLEFVDSPKDGSP